MRTRRLIVTAVAAVLAMPGGLAAASSHVETFVAFDASKGEFPEGIAVDKTGNVYVSMIVLNQIRKIDRDGGQSVMTTFQVPGTGPAGLNVDPTGTVYAAVGAANPSTFETDPAHRGVYRVRADGTNERLPGTGAMFFPNDVTLDKRGNVYATDTAGGAVWRISRNGSAELWANHPLLKGDGHFGFGFPIGANGIAVRHNTVIVANTERGLLVEIPIEPDGSAGSTTLLAESPAVVGADGIALDVLGNVYVGVNPQNTVVRVGNDGSIATLATADDGLNQPSTLAFGTTAGDQQTLFVANFSLFSPSPTPGVLKLPVGVPGQPLP
jgi:sugar lactone lactonase YvrE